MKKLVPYYRVSTRKQEQSGLGLDAQESAFDRFRSHEEHVVLAEFTEIETGKSSSRRVLQRAIALCKEHGAILVVAKLDRLARNVLFTSTLMESGVEFVCCDMPTANRLTIHIMAAMAEDEARRISTRTREALAELRDAGVKLGSARVGHWEAVEQKHGRNLRGWNGMDEARKMRAIADRFAETYKEVIPLVQSLAERGETTYRIADTLNLRNMKTSRGAKWTSAAVSRVLAKLQVA